MGEEGLAFWEVVGGEDKGGLLVRVGKRLVTDALPELLSVGSIVRQLDLSGNRLHYCLLAGSGPEEGWVSLSLKQNRVLLEERTKEQADERIRALQTSESFEEKQQPAAKEAEEEEVPSEREQQAGERPVGNDVEDQEPAQEPAQDDDGKPDCFAPVKSEVREEPLPTTPEAWAEAAKQKTEAGLKEEAAKTLQDAADAMLRSGLFEEARKFASDSLKRWELLGHRVPLAIAYHTIAKARLEFFRSLEGTEVTHALLLCQEAEGAADTACGLLRRIEDTEEEAHLAAARYTLLEARALVESLRAPLSDEELEEAPPRQQPKTQTQPQAGPAFVDHCHPQDTQAIAEKLLETARALLKKGMADNASQIAREAVEHYRLLGSRWKQGIAWDLLARSQLEILKQADALFQSGKGSHAQVQSTRLQHREGAEGALASACKAVALLITIGDPKEEEDLNAAFKTFDEVAKQFGAGDEVLLAETLQSSAEALFRDGKAKGASELAHSAVEHYRKIAASAKPSGYQGLSKALETVAKIELRILIQEFAINETSQEATFGSDHLTERHRLAVSAATEAVKVLEEPASSHPQLSLPLAGARCTLVRVRAFEPTARTSRVQQVQDALQKQTARSTLEGLAQLFKENALRLLMDRSCGQALLLALSAASCYQEIGIARQLGLVLDLIANVHLEIANQLEGTREGKTYIVQHLHEALGSAKAAVERLEDSDSKDAAHEQMLKAAQSTLDRAQAVLSGAGASRGRQGGLTAMEAKLCPLKHTFGYIQGLEKPLCFARFDVRPEVCKHIGGFTHGQEVADKDGNKFVVVGVKAEPNDSLPKMWFQPKSLGFRASGCFRGLEAPALKAVLSASEAAPEPLQEALPEDHDAVEDADHELIDLCHECLLPLGVNRYAAENGDGKVHGECMAQTMLDTARAQDRARKEREMNQKVLDRDEYTIGWKPSRMIRSNKEFLEEYKLRCSPGPARSFMYSVVIEGSTPWSARLVQTSDPEGAVNVAYLSMALQVRSKAGVAPMFSLDIPRSDEPWQVKTFGPPWLRGTCMGEVLFQADYHLKELSMGLAEQPVAGMQNVWDFPWLQEEWRGREWFVVRKATVHLSDSNVLVPKVDMGVEARQQVADENNNLVDVPVTSKEHPLVKYAEVFTRNFDLIAERKSVFYQLREVSKAAILAKFLLDNKVVFDEGWLQAVEKPCHCKMEIPFNRLERAFYHVLVCDGVIKEQHGHGGQSASCTGIYGGVDLNIDAFDLSLPDVIPKRLEKQEYEQPQPKAPPDLSTLSQRELRQRIQQAGGQLPRGPAEKSHLIELLAELESKDEVSSPKAPGNDEDTQSKAQPLMGEEEAILKEELRRFGFNEDQVNAAVLAARRARQRVSSGFPMSTEALINSFWDGLNDESAEHSQLLRMVFNKRMCDRRQDGDLFTPPVMVPTYLQSLKQLVDQERQLQEKRKTHFLSKDFVLTAPGSLFPTSWEQVFSISFARGSSVAAGGSAARGRRLQETQADPAAVMQGKPVFDKVSEDGVRFRVYRKGLQEVRTLQEGSDDERVGAVFEQSAAPKPREHHPVVKVTQFVCSAQAGASMATDSQPAASKDAGSQGVADSELFRYFVVYETDLGDSILTERLPSGQIAWEENPLDLEDLCLQARVMCAIDSAGSGLTVREVREQRHQTAAGQCTSSRRYAEWAISQVGGTLLVGGRARRQLVVPQLVSEG